MRLLHSVACAKYKLLIKQPAGRDIKNTDSFVFNTGFTDRMRRIKVWHLPQGLSAVGSITGPAGGTTPGRNS